MSDITGKIVCLPENSDASALGAGIAAAVDTGWYPMFQAAAQEMIGIEKTIEPDRQCHEKYQQLFEAY